MNRRLRSGTVRKVGRERVVIFAWPRPMSKPQASSNGFPTVSAEIAYLGRCTNQTQRLDWERYRTSGETCVLHLQLIRFSRFKEAKGGPNNCPPFGGADKYDPNVISIAMHLPKLRQQMQRVDVKLNENPTRMKVAPFAGMGSHLA
jgi:hypothetical protein